MREVCWVQRNNAGLYIKKGIIYVFLGLYALGSIFPFYWTLISSFKNSNEILVYPLQLPKAVKLANYSAAWIQGEIGMYYINTFIVSFVPVVLVLLFASMAAYVLARVRPNFTLYSYFILGIMIPVQVMLLPSFRMIKSFGLSSSKTGLILVYTAVNLSLAIFILYGFMKSIPYEIEDSALVDGCSKVRTFFSIIFPLSKPGLATVGILTLINCWNEYLIPLVLIAKKENNVLSIAIRNLQSEFITDYGLLTAGIVISILPVIILYILFQEQVIKGMTAGAVKG
jgi:raffinose/stachyose/melibiose transport system permease protein